MELRNKTILYSVLLILGLGLVAGFLIYPLWNSIKAKSAQLEEEQEKIVELEIQNQQLNSLQATLKEKRSNLETLDNLFINREAPVDFLSFLEQTAVNSDVNINISPSAGQKGNDPWPPTFFSVEGTGNFEDCVKLITKLEYAPYLIRIQSLDLQRIEEKKEEKVVKQAKVNLLIKVY